MDLGPHAAFIWTAYGLVTLVLAGSSRGWCSMAASRSGD